MSSPTSQHKEHVLPLGVYLSVASALFVFTVITVAAAQIDLGPFNLVVALLIAAVKASLVALYFMHLKYDNKLYALIFVSSLIFLALFIIFTMFDTLRRGDIYKEVENPIETEAVLYDSLAVDSSSATEMHNPGDGHGADH